VYKRVSSWFKSSQYGRLDLNRTGISWRLVPPRPATSHCTYHLKEGGPNNRLKNLSLGKLGNVISATRGARNKPSDKEAVMSGHFTA